MFYILLALSQVAAKSVLNPNIAKEEDTLLRISQIVSNFASPFALLSGLIALYFIYLTWKNTLKATQITADNLILSIQPQIILNFHSHRSYKNAIERIEFELKNIGNGICHQLTCDLNFGDRQMKYINKENNLIVAQRETKKLMFSLDRSDIDDTVRFNNGKIKILYKDIYKNTMVTTYSILFTLENNQVSISYENTERMNASGGPLIR
jgi:hypothetical protein